MKTTKAKYIYYIGVEKYKEGKYTEDTGGITGIYRMKLNGKGKKRLVKAGKYDTISNLGVTSRGLVYKKNETWYKCSLNGKNRKKASGDLSSNMSVKHNPLSRNYAIEFSVCKTGYAYFPVVSRNKIVRNSWDKGGELFTYPGDLQKILISGKHMMVISESTDLETVYAYMMTPAGGRQKLVVQAPSMGRMWDY